MREWLSRKLARVWVGSSRKLLRPGSRRWTINTETFQVLESRLLMTVDSINPFSPILTCVGENVDLPGVDTNGDSYSDKNAIFSTPAPLEITGASFPVTMRVGQLGAQVSVNVSHVSAGDYWDGWIDWNGDGNWGGAAEQIAFHIPAIEGENTFQIDVPAWAKSGPIMACFRPTTTEGVNGELKKNPFTLLPPVYPSGDFEAVHPLDATASVQYTSAADLDGDGDMDILSATFNGSGTIAWYENNGDQEFIRHIISSTANEATTVIATDLNGDGYLDVISSSLANNEIVWYQNDGHQQFAAHTITTSAWNVSNLFVADLDGDGDPDILATTKGDNAVAWYENTTNQTFTRHLITNEVDAPCSVFAVDIDGDGDLDVVSASFLDDKIAWYENDGSQAFVKRNITTSADGVRGMYVADVNGDGYQDIVASCLYSSKILWYQNDGHGSFVEHVITSTAMSVSTVFVADMDGDGDMDILGASRGDSTIAWYENTNGAYFPKHVVTTSNSEARCVIAADVNGDGSLDIISATKSGNCLAWYENQENPYPLTVSLDSPSRPVASDPTIPVTVSLNRPITGFTAASLIIQNGTVTDFNGNGSTYSFSVVADHEGTVTISLPRNTLQDAKGYGNTRADLTREYTVAKPLLTSPDTTTIFIRNGGPIPFVPNLTVAGSRIGGGSIVIVMNSIKPGKSMFDELDVSSLSGLGILTRTTISDKQITHITLNSTTTANDVQAALRAMTVNASKSGKPRHIQIELIDNSGQSRALLTETIQVRKHESKASRT